MIEIEWFSGSEAESDEDLDLALEEDILEEEAGDRDMAGVSEEALRWVKTRERVSRGRSDTMPSSYQGGGTLASLFYVQLVSQY